MTYLSIADALNDGVKNLIEEIGESVEFSEPQDIASSLNELADICMTYAVGDSTKAEALKEKYSGDSNTAANAGAKFMEAFIELYKKANPSSAQTNNTPSSPSEEPEG